MKKELITFRDPKSPISEVFRTLRTNIQFMNINKKLKTILITSSIPKEGKSWVASNLAIAFAQAEKKVLLIDADMRKGRQYSIFGVSPRPGLANYLAEYKEGEEIDKTSQYIQETEIEGLHLIAAGNVPPNPSELLITPQMNNLLKIMSEYYDILIVDAPPCELVTDAAIISRLVDTTVVVAAHKQTKKTSLQKTIRSIKNVGGNIAGVVFNKVPVDAKKYEKSYYYGSQLVPTTNRNGRSTFVSRNDFEGLKKNKEEQNNEKYNEVEEKDKIENNIQETNNTKDEEKIVGEETKIETNATFMGTEKTEEILKQVNEYLEKEKKNLEESKRKN